MQQVCINFLEMLMFRDRLQIFLLILCKNKRINFTQIRLILEVNFGDDPLAAKHIHLLVVLYEVISEKTSGKNLRLKLVMLIFKPKTSNFQGELQLG